MTFASSGVLNLTKPCLSRYGRHDLCPGPLSTCHQPRSCLGSGRSLAPKCIWPKHMTEVNDPSHLDSQRLLRLGTSPLAPAWSWAHTQQSMSQEPWFTSLAVTATSNSQLTQLLSTMYGQQASLWITEIGHLAFSGSLL